MLEKDTDIILFHSLKAGNEEALDLLFKKYYAPLCQYAQVFLADTASCEDVISELFADIWIKKKELHITKSFKSYVYRSAKNAALIYLRKKRINTIRLEDVKEYTIDTGQCINSKYSEEHTRLNIQKIMERIPPRSREVFVLHRFEGMKYKEIAEFLGISVKTVENHMGKALKTLHQHQDFLLKIVGGVVVVSLIHNIPMPL